jgi:hypothetical protein
MPVAFVAGTTLVHGSELFGPLTAAAPTGLQSGDVLLAFLFVRSAPTPPSGWTQLLVSPTFDQDGAGLDAQTVYVYGKNTVSPADSGANFDWDQADNELRIGVVYGAFRDASTVSGSSTSTSDVGTYQITPPTVVATDNGQMLVCIGSTIFATLPGDEVSPSFPASFTRFSGDGLNSYRLAAAYRAVNLGASNSGAIDMAPGETTTTNGLGAITLLIESVGIEALPGWIEAASPLYTSPGPAILAQDNIVGARIGIETILGSPAILGYFDLAPYVADKPPTRFVMDLVTPDGFVRIPISSWQATLQTGAAQYLTCVIPSPEQWVDAIGVATEFRIAGIIELLSGATTEYALASAPLQTVQYAQGGTNYSATISGYTPAPVDVSWPTTTDRALRGIQTLFTSSSGRRVRCSVDWSLRPGQRAVLEGIPFVVRFINYSISEGGQSMDVGELIEVA